MSKTNSFLKVMPVLFGFFIMGFVDVVGISTSYVQADFGLSDSIANLLPMMVFLWFAVFSVPTGMLMNKIGRKNTVLLSMVITFCAMLVPLVAYDYIVVLIAFALLGIGNTILQVSLNPLVSNVVSQDKLTSRLTLGQFIKAIASFLGPIIAGFAAATLGGWKMLFPIFAGATLLSSIWLWLTPISEDERVESTTSFGQAFGLLGDRAILLLFFGILFVVGADVGMNMVTPKLLMERGGMALEQAGLGTSTYFAARTVGALTGAILLAKFSARGFFKISMFVAIGAMVLLMISSGTVLIFTMVAVIGFALANIFSIIFSLALQKRPERGNEISGLMIMGVAGGAILPPLMGLASDAIGQIGGLLVIFAGLLYLLFTAFVVKVEKK
ncbi:MFS transporter [Marinilabilia salmonicolor]|uniref:MFS transporter n=1 Tax=Marinilabilia salmonicolor TaxID=989 RepID=UPI000316A4DA|nr:MFS transporter [Marinilabilia salmonicolor]